MLTLWRRMGERSGKMPIAGSVEMVAGGSAGRKGASSCARSGGAMLVEEIAEGIFKERPSSLAEGLRINLSRLEVREAKKLD